MSATIPPGRIGRIRLDRGPLRFFMATEPIVVATAGIRGGKTHTGALKMACHALAHPTADDEFHVVASPTFPMSRVPQEKFFRLFYDPALFPVSPVVRFYKSDRVFVLACAGGRTSRIKIVSGHDPDRWRGFKWLSAWLDEAAYLTAYAWDVAQGRLVDSAGPAWLTTTPAGYNWLYDLYLRAQTDTSIRFVHWRTSENSHMFGEGANAQRTRLADLAMRFDSVTAAQELEAFFVKSGGLVYHAFERAEHVVPARLNPALELFVGVDFNVSPMSAILMQPFSTREGVEGCHVIGEHYIENGDTYALMAWLVNYCNANRLPRSKVTVYPDASGRSRSTSGKSDHEIIREAGFAVDAPRANPLVRDRVNTVNGLFSPQLLRFPRLLIDPSATRLIDALEHQKRDDRGEPDKELGHDHPVDALGYALWRRYPLVQQGGVAA